MAEKKKRITLLQRVAQLEHAFANLAQVVERHHQIFREVADEHKRQQQEALEKAGIVIEQKDSSSGDDA